MACAALGVTPVDSSEEGAPVRELIKLSVLGEPLVDSLQEPMPAEERLEYAIQATASIWEPLEQVRYVVSGNVDPIGQSHNTLHPPPDHRTHTTLHKHVCHYKQFSRHGSHTRHHVGC